MIIGILSYLPDNEDVRRQRIKYHRKQIEQFLHLGCPIYIVAQNYKEEDYYINSNVFYFKFEKGIGMAGARNVLLSFFFNSDEDWMMLCDDDAYYYDYYNIDVFFDELKSNPNKFNQLDLIRGKFASKVPFKKVLDENPDVMDNYVFIDEGSIGSLALCIIKNWKKYYNKEFYFGNENPKKGEGYEDRNFCCRIKLGGIKTHVLQTFIMTTYNYTDNSTLFSTYEDRMKLHKMNVQSSLNAFKDTDFYVDGKMNTKYKSKPIYIPRIKRLVLTEKEKPKQKTTGSLFKSK